MQKTPVITCDGPIFIDPIRYYCGTHNSRITAGAAATTRCTNREAVLPDQDDPFLYNIPYYRLRDMRYATRLLPELQAQYVETLSASGVCRHLAGRWLSTAVGRMETLKRTQAELRLTTRGLVEASRLVFALADLVPHRDTITSLQLVLFQNLVLPHIPKYDEAVCAFDGQVIKMDGTFRSASAVLAYGGLERTFKGRCVVKRFKVASCVLVALGTEGLNLVTPRLVPAENTASLTKMAEDILRNRRRVLGSLSAPAAFSTDNIRQHRNALMEGFLSVYPELRVTLEDGKSSNININQVVLLLQDITPSVGIHDCKTCQEEFRNAAAEATSQEEPVATQRAFRLKLQRALLTPQNAGVGDDETLGFAIDNLGMDLARASSLIGHAVPIRLCMRGARRLLKGEDAIERLFPSRGYVSGEEFVNRLEAVNEFYKTVRSAAALETTHFVASQLGKKNYARKSGTRRKGKRRVTESAVVPAAEKPEEWEGITAKAATNEVMNGVREETTLRGLLSHGLIPGICTEEVTVEAMNRQLNSNVRQGSIGYDVAEMRLCYQRLKWDSSAIQRILAGDTSRKRRQNVQALSVWNLTKLMLSHTTARGVFTSQMLPVEKRTTVADLISGGYRLRRIGEHWSDEEIGEFFDACERSCTTCSRSTKEDIKRKVPHKHTGTDVARISLESMTTYTTGYHTVS